MKILMRIVFVSLFLVLCIISSCSKEEIPEVEPDFSIQSTSSFDVVSTYENGWIAHAIAINDFTGLKIAEFEYHQNGYLKNCKSYTHGDNTTDNHYLSLEVNRDENNLPTSSIYYFPNGSIQAEISYENGLIKEKKVFDNEQNITCTYSNGRIELVINETGEHSTEIDYDYTANRKIITISESGNIEYVFDLPLVSAGGEGISTVDNYPRANRFADEDSNANDLNSSYASSYSWERIFEPTKIMPVPVIYDGTNFFGLLNGYFSHDFDAFRMIVEEYPYFEDGLLNSQFTVQNEEISFYPSIESAQEVKVELSTDLETFELQYGDEFLRKSIIGKYGFTIGTLRNLPSDPTLRQQIKDLAYQKAGSLLGSPTSLTEEEETLLRNVFFEYKYYSPVLGLHGKILATTDDYVNATEQVTSNSSYIIQKVYKAYENL